ncbi:hypothetical protein C8R44DRAFT_889401 [Mycena epipterygia]|nr:hypothetical protein C8R44DRAFT_889401 [Mycena epipterygia]
MMNELGVGAGATFTLEVQIVGKNQRLEICFELTRITYYDIYEDKEIETLYREFIARIGPELTHNSEAWACSMCGLPATDTSWFCVYTPSLYRRCTVLIHKACEKCMPKMHEILRNITAGPGSENPSVIGGMFSKPDGMREVRAAACLSCQQEETAAPEFPMSRCAKCQLVSSVIIRFF